MTKEVNICKSLFSFRSSLLLIFLRFLYFIAVHPKIYKFQKSYNYFLKVKNRYLLILSITNCSKNFDHTEGLELHLHHRESSLALAVQIRKDHSKSHSQGDKHL